HKEMGEPFALAVPGKSPLAAEPAAPHSVKDPELVQRVSDYLKKKRVDVPQPYLTQAFDITLSREGQKGILVCAHSDAKAMRDDQAAPVYALALLMVPDGNGWRTYALQEQTSYKPASRTIDEH